MQTTKSKKKQSPARPAVGDYTRTLFIDELKENTRHLQFEETVKSLQGLGDFLSMTGELTDDTDLKDQMISGMSGIISALSYVSLMHSTVRTFKAIEGGKSC